MLDDQGVLPYLNHQWIQYNDGLVAIGVTEEALEEFSDIFELQLPEEGDEVEAEMVFGEAETNDGSLNLYSPISGTVIEINPIALECLTNSSGEPPENWLVKIEPSDPGELDEFTGVDYRLEDDE